MRVATGDAVEAPEAKIVVALTYVPPVRTPLAGSSNLNRRNIIESFLS